MKAIWSTLAIVLAFTSSTLVVSPAEAATVNLDTSNALGTNPAGVNFLFVTVTDGAAGAVDFRVEINPALVTNGNSSPGIQAFSFNFGSLGVTGDNLVLPEGWSVKGGNGNHSNFGNFDIQIQGTGNTRQNPLLFSVQGINGDSAADYVSFFSQGGQQSSLFAAHVPGLHVTGSGGAHFGGSSVVPLPAAIWLMLSALGLLGIRARTKGSRRTAAKVKDRKGFGFAGEGMLPWGWQVSEGIAPGL